MVNKKDPIALYFQIKITFNIQKKKKNKDQKLSTSFYNNID